MNTEILTATYSHEIPQTVRGDDDSDDRWSVKKFIANGCGEITAVGCCRKSKLQPRQMYRLFGRWTINDYGKQFQFTSLAVTEPADLSAIEKYIQKSRGIGEAKAKKIVGTYGEKTLEMCRTKICQVEMECGLPQSVGIELSEFLKRNQRLEQLTLEVESLLAGRGFPRTLPQKVIERWGVEAVETIRENPYRLRDFQGVGFRLCDALYEHLGLPMDALIRQTHCVLYAIESDMTGSTWISRNQIEAELRQKIGGAKLRIDEAIKDATDEGMICERHVEAATSERSALPFEKTDTSDSVGGAGAKAVRQRAARQSFYAVANLADAESSLVSDLVECVNESLGRW